MFVVGVVLSFEAIIIPTIRSILSKLVSQEEQGTLLYHFIITCTLCLIRCSVCFYFIHGGCWNCNRVCCLWQSVPDTIPTIIFPDGLPLPHTCSSTEVSRSLVTGRCYRRLTHNHKVNDTALWIINNCTHYSVCSHLLCIELNIID